MVMDMRTRSGSVPEGILERMTLTIPPHEERKVSKSHNYVGFLKRDAARLIL